MIIKYCKGIWQNKNTYRYRFEIELRIFRLKKGLIGIHCKNDFN